MYEQGDGSTKLTAGVLLSAGQAGRGVPAEVYQACVAWCAQNGYHPLNASNFGKEVKRAFSSARRESTRVCGKYSKVYKGLAVKEDSEVATVLFCGRVDGGL